MSHPALTEPCTARCAERVECTTCRMPKAPIGRSVPLECGASYCDTDCPGYRQDPHPPHLWPSEWPPEAQGESP